MAWRQGDLQGQFRKPDEGKCGGETKRVLRKNSRDKGHSQLNIIKAWLFRERAILKGIMVRLIPETLTFTDTENMWVVV